MNTYTLRKYPRPTDELYFSGPSDRYCATHLTFMFVIAVLTQERLIFCLGMVPIPMSILNRVRLRQPIHMRHFNLVHPGYWQSGVDSTQTIGIIYFPGSRGYYDMEPTPLKVPCAIAWMKNAERTTAFTCQRHCYTLQLSTLSCPPSVFRKSKSRKTSSDFVLIIARTLTLRTLTEQLSRYGRIK